MIPVSKPFRIPHNAIGPISLFFAIMTQREDSVEFSTCFQGFQKTYPFRGKPIVADPLHLSVYGVYRDDDLLCDIVQAAIQTGDAIKFAPFSLTFNTALTYRDRRSKKPFVLAAQANSEAVSGLRLQIANAFSEISEGACYKHNPIGPHVRSPGIRTIVPKQAIKPVNMIIQKFLLIHSRIGKLRYDVLKPWQLNAS